MNLELDKAIEAVKRNKYSFCKFVSSNDAGDTGGHQGGIYIPKNSIRLMFESPGIKGENKEKYSDILWANGETSRCRFIYYGKGSRNEYRITRLGKQLHLNDLVVITRESDEKYQGFILSEKKEIDFFLRTFGLKREDTNSLIKFDDQFFDSGSYTFKPRAGIIKVIGQELISSDVIALVELIKNSYDADSTEVEIELNSIFSENGSIIIKDDGVGMSFDKIVNVWLEPATPDKKSNIEKKFSSRFKRRLLGEKGIGRFAAHRLGNNIELISRSRSEFKNQLNDYETVVQIDWTLFSEDKYLEEIPIVVHKRLPMIYTENEGTLIKISSIHPWKNFDSIKEAVIKINGLESPVKPLNQFDQQNHNITDPGFDINITSDDIQIDLAINNIKSLSELLDSSFYKFRAIIFGDGSIKYNYDFYRPDQQDISRSNHNISDSLIKYDVEWFEKNTLSTSNSPGEFEVSFFAWDLDSTALKVAGLADYYKNIIRPNTGVRVHRDGFRVWPYGEPNNDWLELDLTRMNAPKERSVSRNQIFGLIHISSSSNPELKDQSNREGFIVNEHYENFYHLVNASLTIFAKERKSDKVKIDRGKPSRSNLSYVNEQIDKLKNTITQNNHWAIYKKPLEDIERAYEKTINDVIDRYMMAAAIGISYSIPIHEMKLRLSSIRNVVEDIERNADIEDKFLRELTRQLNETQNVIDAVSSIMSKQKSKLINLLSVGENIRILKGSDFIKNDIEFKVFGNGKLEIEAVPGLVNTAVLNLVDNSVHWLRAKKIDPSTLNASFKASITIEVGVNEENRKFLKVSDNGPGFSDPFELLVEPYYSQRNDGLGLGLYLVNSIIAKSKGRVKGYNNNSGGATVELVF